LNIQGKKCKSKLCSSFDWFGSQKFPHRVFEKKVASSQPYYRSTAIQGTENKGSAVLNIQSVRYSAASSSDIKF